MKVEAALKPLEDHFVRPGGEIEHGLVDHCFAHRPAIQNRLAVQVKAVSALGIGRRFGENLVDAGGLGRIVAAPTHR